MVAGHYVGKSTLLVSWIKIIKRILLKYMQLILALGICQIMDINNVTNVSEIEDMSSFIEEIEENLMQEEMN